ncbi:ATP-binding cassette domain-containing protein [Candidatus Fermentibacterales bacterium]|nr:ATP-binding cassette domain-containing protein [Candidatus Fermentibacterales bacterium]
MRSGPGGSPELIRVRNLRGGYGKLLVLENVSMEVLEGEILLIVGRSGCGKTTLMNYLLGLARPWAGQILYRGSPLVFDGPSSLTAVRRRWGVLFQSGALLASLSLLENVALPLTEFTELDASEADLVAMSKLALVGLEEFADSLPLEVSGGMQKRAGLARALAMDPDVLFFDEPSAGLDPVTSGELDELIRRLNGDLGTTMVIVTHELASIFAVSDRVIMLDAEEKGIIAEGTAHQLRDSTGDERVSAFFNRRPVAGGAAR